MKQNMQTVAFPDEATAPKLGQGTWYMGAASLNRVAEADALRLGLDLGMTLIDTAEMYAAGKAEEVVGDAIAGRRDEAFIVSKVLPSNASRSGIPKACEDSLRRMRIETIDLYLYHWRGSFPLAETVEALERLRQDGKIARWGVSNFDTSDMHELSLLPDGAQAQTNQVLYNLGRRGIEFDLLPWQRKRGIPTMAYSPIEQGGLAGNRKLETIARRHKATPAQIALAWVMREGDVIAIPKASNPDHVRENRGAADIVLTPEDLTELNAAFPPPSRKGALEML